MNKSVNKSDVRYRIADIFRGQLSTFADKQASNTLYRVVTQSAEDSLWVVEGVADLGDMITFFQGYNLDDNGSGGSVFIIGGSEQLGRDIITLWHRSPSITFDAINK